MLIITEEQMSNLRQVPLKQFERDMFTYLTDNFSEYVKDKPKQELQTFIYEGIEQAEQYQIEFKDDVRRYLEFMVMYAQDFDKNSQTVWAHTTLYSKELDGTTKMDLIDELELEMVRNSL
jgi:hypothetical protein